MKEAQVTPINTEADEIEIPADASNTNERITGKIFFLNTDAEGGGYGFLTSKAKIFSRIYFHWTQLDSSIDFMSLKKHDILSFICVRHVDKEGNDKGWRAIKIEKV